MIFLRTYNYSVAILLIAIYLVLPSTIFAHAAASAVGTAAVAAVCDDAAAPCKECPGEKGAACCDSTFCTCACHAPLCHGLRLVYAPMITVQSFKEPLWSFPQVYRSIFVPPQNLA
jgi:hypothetical protein